MKILINLKVQNVSDIITNSSSEMFVIRNNMGPAKMVKELIESFAEKHYYWKNEEELDDLPDYYKLPWKEMIKYDGSGGMGGEIEIVEYDLHDDYEKECKYNGYMSIEEYINRYYPGISEKDFDKFIYVDIDRERYATMDFLMKTFDCYCLDIRMSWMLYDEKTKRVIGIDENFKQREL